MSDAKMAAEWLEYEGERQRRAEIGRLERDLEEVRRMSARDFVRQRGVYDVCPREVHDDVRFYLRVRDGEHFSVRADSGNEGVRLEVTQGQTSRNDVIDPWDDRPWDDGETGRDARCEVVSGTFPAGGAR